jgi:predicted transglutaminase-like cysteine proteinase
MRLLVCATALFTLYAGYAGGVDESRVPQGIAVKPPIGWIEFCHRLPRECIASPGLGSAYFLTEQRWEEMLTINHGVNHLVLPVTDLKNYAVLEYWTYPDNGFGDCEDYVLLKRRMLLQSGWPSSQLLIATVLDEYITGHAVLIVRTSRADYVLDNMTDDVLPWDQTTFKRYLKLQSKSDPNKWVRTRNGMPVGSLKQQ